MPSPPRYLVEWYRPEVTDDLLDLAVARIDASASLVLFEGAPVRLLMALSAPSDEVVFGLFAAASAASVAQVCRHAGWPAERLTEVVERVPRGPVDTTRWRAPASDTPDRPGAARPGVGTEPRPRTHGATAGRAAPDRGEAR
jgi:hypothetical protein